ncbi:hypothetical protein O181_012484 [Austropuccinia psidii MF-1]|uniref:Uncharacterized protein n=1 Tax=Austropuccinia psidii MF-1 TaxID=1389203 RepID=A0A9Q3BUQ6_9BASI|nr:hypothetical protein [Austropuccinia psidii MF-1]
MHGEYYDCGLLIFWLWDSSSKSLSFMFLVRFQANHSNSNSDSILNLTNFCLHQSAPTIHPASLLHYPHLDDLLTINPSKLNLKDLQQSPKHLHQYLDSNISPLSTYQTSQSTFHPPLESNNHFITCSKKSNSSNSVPSNSQKLFQTDSQITQSPFQNLSGSLASASR